MMLPKTATRKILVAVPAASLRVDSPTVDEEEKESKATKVARIAGLLAIAGVSLLACVFGGANGVVLAVLGPSLLVCAFYPRYWWPSAAATLLFLVPFAYASGGVIFSYLVPSTVIMFLYVLGNLGQRPEWMGHGVAILMGLLAVYCAFQIPFGGSDNNSRKLIWILLLFFVVLLPSIVSSDPRMIWPLALMVLVCGATLSVFGITEYVFKANVLSEFYAAAPSALTQKWGDYRILTIAGHPLVNATLLAVAGTAGLAVYLKWNYRSALLVLGLTASATILTQSRTGIAALVVGVGFALLGSMRGRSQGRFLASFSLLALAVVVFMQVDSPLAQRNSSVEGQGSSELRFAYLDNLPDLMQASSMWGTGPGLSDSALQKAGGYAAGFPIESSAVQILVSMGILGSVFLVAAILGVLVLSVRRGAFIAPAMLAAYLVAASGFNLFEAFPTLVALSGVLLSACVAEACVHTEQKLDRSHKGKAIFGARA
ncbi:O-antigen ligase family protein [Pseudarthrobacter sp. MDT3-26]|uniref:O-antigen ligase family protein n=1 Tax=Pseudarthrobacter raffinosi TaxID=2953651 RepID=UPI00208FA1E8|nr:O-antigen ligase family protein [Pseudarthrobacter sp. MDT3-26]MCO4264404.1 O-antigen ligase family protein [Pseudarthrobacter sp. MDT3-26]